MNKLEINLIIKLMLETKLEKLQKKIDKEKALLSLVKNKEDELYRQGIIHGLVSFLQDEERVLIYVVNKIKELTKEAVYE